jgi:DNA-binding beta-propeller fold protein YncE
MMMKALAFAVGVVCLAVPFARQQAVPQRSAASPSVPKQTSAPELAFDSVQDFFKLPEGMNFGEVAGVAVNSKGHIFVFTRSNSAFGPAYGPTAAQLLEFGPKGEFIREVGKGLYGWSFAHSVRIDRDDNIWAIDKGSDMVIKLNRQGRVMWVFGRRQESADGAKPWEHVDPPLPARDGMFRQPTDVAWDSKGNIYITDGYINSRVAKYDMNGDWVMQWGTRGTGPAQFNTPHSIVIDRNDNIYVGDRGNRRVQIFDTEGRFLRQWTIDIPPVQRTKAVNGPTPPEGSMQGVGAPNSLCIPPGQNEIMFLGESTWPGRVFKITLDGRVLGIIGRSGRNIKQFSGAHALACPSENEIYVAESSNWRVQRIILHSTRLTTSAGG